MEFDRTVIEQVIEATGMSAKGEGASELPHPMATDAELTKHLDALGRDLIIEDAPVVARSTKEKLSDRASGRDPAQKDHNSHVVHALHQLDHRTRYQRAEIDELRNELADAREQIVQLHRRIDRLSGDK